MQTKYIKYYRYAVLFATICIVSTSVLFTSCKKGENDTATVLNSFGPMPIARGAELQFIGKNLDNVTSIVLPPNIEITTFTTKSSTLITLIVPQEATPGLIVLNTPQGEITTKTEIGFSEPISIATFTPATIKPGSELTITGDYLNLVANVIFTDRVSVPKESFTSQSRTEIKLNVPAISKTGKIAVSNGAEDPIIVYSASALTITLPVFTTISPNPVKAGTQLTIAGTDLDLVKTVILGGNKNVTTFVSQTATQIVLAVPVDTKDGKVILTPASAVNVESSVLLQMIVPTVIVSPTTLKNGADITVTGTNLDLVDKVLFAGSKQGTIKAGGTATQILVTVPIDAITGIVTFVTKAIKEVTGPSITIVDPVFTSFSPASAKASSDLTITGSDLDLVVDVLFFGGIKGTIGTRTDTQLTVKVPIGAKTGKISLLTKNGNQVLSATDLIILANLPVIDSFTEPKGTPGQKLTINGTNLLLIKELVFPDNIYATAFGEKTDTRVEVYVPMTVTRGNGFIKMITYEGEEGLMPMVYFGAIDPVLNQTLCFFDFNGTGKDSWWGNAIGSGPSNDMATAADGTPYWRINGMSGTGWYDGLFFRNGNNNFVTTGVQVNTWAVKFDINVIEPIKEGVLKIRFANYYYEFKPWEGLPDGYKTTGWITVTCPLTGFKDGVNVIPDAATGGGEFGMIWASGNSVKINMGIDNIRFEPLP
jgi:Surface glycan-binding protein B xyloglucan binding domain/IPT/TIG domain